MARTPTIPETSPPGEGTQSIQGIANLAIKSAN
ncbi:hypothetical protein BG618_01829 [Pseudonocardia autotrophica]|nr:hypothetical protein BG618_01829 [Pseudonocardia autotrophica]